MYWKNANQPDKEYLELKGNVKQLMQVVYKATRENGNTVPGTIIVDHGSDDQNFIFTFNSEGNITEEELYGQHFRTINRYDEKGQKSEEIKYYLGELYSVTTNKYSNKQGYILESITNNAEGRLMHRYENTYTPDTNQQLLHISYFPKNGKEFVMRKSEHTYRDEVITINNTQWRQPLTVTETNKDGKITSNHTYIYNEKGLLIESNTDYRESPHMSRKTTYKHNSHGDVIETNFYNPDGTLQNSYVTAHEYDSEGKKIVPVRTPPAPFVNRPDAIMLFNEGDETDENGNWIKKITHAPDKYITRMIVYEGETKTLEHPLLNIANIPKETEREIDYERYRLEDKDAEWIVEWPTASGENFPFYRYYTRQFNEVPSMLLYQGPHIEAMMLLNLLKEKFSADMVHSYTTDWNGTNFLQRYTLNFSNHWGYMLHCHGIAKQNIEEFSVTSEIKEKDNDYVYTSQFSLLRPSDVNKGRDESFEREIDEYIYKCSLRKKPEKPVINIIEVKSGNYSMAEYAVNDDFIIKDLDINYGQGFEKFHNELMQRFNKSTKGLVLFHGEPGTGKTYYIRHLLRKMVANRKAVIYIPPNMVDHLVDPGFMTFLSGELKEWSGDGYFCVLLIEDAEPLLAKRQEGIRIQGVTNLLNMTDGLLNDMLNLQIICTFNVDISKLDSALLRPGRLIARKEFKPLSELDANLLAQRLGIKHHFEQPASLGEIYAMQKNQHTLVHEVDAKKNTSSAIDDL